MYELAVTLKDSKKIELKRRESTHRWLLLRALLSKTPLKQLKRDSLPFLLCFGRLC